MPNISLLTNRREAESSISQNLDLAFGTNASRGDSNTRILSNIISTELLNLNNETRNYLENLSYLNARGEDLNSLGFEYYGLQRIPGNRASTNVGDTNFFFSPRENGTTFGDINNGQAIILPKGTRISNFPNITTGSEIVYQTKREYTLNANAYYAYCEIEAVEIGSRYNVGKDVLLHHDFTNYATAPSNSLVCRNSYPIINGAETENDDSFRYRIANYISSQKRLNEESVRLAGLEIPGVIQTKIIPGYYGLGTTGIVVFGPEKNTPYNSLSVIERRIRSSTGEENRIFAVEGIYVKIDMQLEIIKTSSLSFEEEENIRQDLQNEVLNLIRQSYSSNTLNLNFVERRIRRYLSSNKIVRIEQNQEYDHKFKLIRLSKTDIDIENDEESITYAASSINLNDEERLKLNSFSISFTEDNTNV